MIYAAAIIALTWLAALVALGLALGRTLAQQDRQQVYMPAVRSGEGSYAEGKDAPHGCGPRIARQNASSVASIAGTGATIHHAASTERAGTPGTGSLRDYTLNAELARPDRGLRP